MPTRTQWLLLCLACMPSQTGMHPPTHAHTQEASCGHAAAFGQCNAGKTIKKMCCASCGGARPDAAKMNGGNGASGNKDVLRKELIADPTPQNKATPSKIPPAQAGCNDLPDLEFKTFYHALKETHWHAFKHEKSCPHAMMQGECADFRIREKCCASCTADDKSICVDKPASEVSAALGLSGVSCGTLAQAGRCDHADVKKNCCARCRKQQYYPQCKDMSEQELRSIVGAVHAHSWIVCMSSAVATLHDRLRARVAVRMLRHSASARSRPSTTRPAAALAHSIVTSCSDGLAKCVHVMAHNICLCPRGLSNPNLSKKSKVSDRRCASECGAAPRPFGASSCGRSGFPSQKSLGHQSRVPLGCAKA